jgi:antitoxin YefM
MKLMPVSEVKAKLSRLVAEIEARDEEIIITRNGRAAAVLLSADQFEGGGRPSRSLPTRS